MAITTDNPRRTSVSQVLSTYGALLTSLTTLLCCALPVLLVSFGMGMAVASLVSSAPWLVFLSRHKNLVFAFSGSLIAVNFFLVYVLPRFRQSRACARGAGGTCEVAGKITQVFFWISLLIYGLGFFMAYLLMPLKLLLEGS